MKKIVVASTNPVKINAALMGFTAMFPEDAFETVGIAVPSGVAEQPMSDSETLLGAQNRCTAARKVALDADYWVGIEGGIEGGAMEMNAFAWIVVQSATLSGKARTGAFYLPAAVSRLVSAGKELGEADDVVFGRQSSKLSEGAIGLLTGGILDRTRLYAHAVMLALVPFKNPGYYRNHR